MMGTIGIGLYAGSLYISYSTADDNADFDKIKQAGTMKIMLLALAGCIATILAALMYYIYDARNGLYYIMLLSCLSFGLSLASVGIVTMAKVGVI